MRKHRKQFLPIILSLAIGSILLSAFNTSHTVFAHTASISTADSIDLDVSFVGDGTSIKEETINVTSTCRDGYTLTVATPEGSDLYQNGDSTSTASFTAVDGTNTLGSTNNTNKWGFTISSNPTASTIFSPLSATASVLKTPSETATSDTDIDDDINIYYGTKVDNTTAVGSHQMANNGAIVYQLTMSPTCMTYTVEFNANGGTGTIVDQEIQTGAPTNLTSADALTAPTGGSYIDADNHTITGDPDKLWTFWGWNTSPDGTGDWYKDRGSVTDLIQTGSTIILYAQWSQPTLADLTTSTPVGTEKTIDHNTMQDMSPAACYNSPITTADNAPAVTLLDYRGKVITDDPGATEQPEQYNVSKLPDGLCWMTTNLNLGRESGGPNNDGTITLTSDDTDLAENTTFTLPASTTTSNTSPTDATIRITNNSGNNDNGTYYSWPASVANTTSTGTNPTTSICPKHWDLPTNTNYTNLSAKAAYSSSNRTDSAPSSFLINGGFTNGATFYQTGYSHFWTNTSNGTTSAYGARIYSNSMITSSNNGTAYGGNKYYRKNIRCLANMGTANLTYYANNGSGSTATQSANIASDNLAPNNLFPAATNKQFKEWNTRADGTGISYSALTPVSSMGLKPSQTLEFYAIWDDIYYISFNANESSVGETPGSATGTMTNQTVITGKATSIKTNAFALSGYMFYGWNTSADGTGTLYSDGQKVTNLTATGNTVTLYAIWVKGAYLDTGTVVNRKLKRLAGNSSATYQTQDTSIAAIVRSNTLPNDFAPSPENTISHSTSIYPIYAWYDSASTTIYYYSEGAKILMNTNSNDFFREMRALSDLSTISTWDTVKIISTSDMFYYTGYSATTFTLDLSSWNTSSVTNMSGMFYYTGYSATTWSIGDLSSWDTSNVTNLNALFDYTGYNATTWSIGDLSSWDTASVTNMASMFSYAGYSATTWSIGDLSSWNTSSVTDMSGMFYYTGYSATTFTLDLSSWNTSNVTNMYNMFNSAGRSATTWSIGDLSSWNTSSVTNMSSMFSYTGYSATTFTLDLSSWNTSSVTNMSSMFSFAGYSAITWAIGDLSSWNTSSVTTMSNMFYSAGHSASTFTLDLSIWNTSSVTNMAYMFSSAGYSASTFTLGLSSWNTSSVTNMGGMFTGAGQSATTWSIGDLSSWNTSSVTNMVSMFSNAGQSATSFSLNLSSWNTSSVTNMASMFYSAGRYATTFTLDLSSWNTSSVTSMYQLFYGAGYSATTWSVGDLSSWNTSNVTTMQYMFDSAGRSATTWSVGDLSSWNTANVTNMSSMFSSAGRYATTFTLDLSSWNTSSVVNMSSMFSYVGRSATTFTLDLSSWNTSSVTNMSGMFTGAGYSATTWSITIPKTNDGTATGPIPNTTSNLYGSSTSVTATPDSGRSFTLAN